TEDSIRKTTKPSFDVQIVILLYLQLNSPYTLCRQKGKLSQVMENGRLSIFISLCCSPVATRFARTVSSSIEVEIHPFGSVYERHSGGSDRSSSDNFKGLSLRRSKTR
ncbi:hypothetical protein MXB_3938, partial [Myxobolus squamalis]